MKLHTFKSIRQSFSRSSADRQRNRDEIIPTPQVAESDLAASPQLQLVNYEVTFQKWTEVTDKNPFRSEQYVNLYLQSFTSLPERVGSMSTMYDIVFGRKRSADVGGFTDYQKDRN
ncbi:hypothetical protein J6590_039710 [Homalodisca vitripennis]|nr:hypothetical protein J6590_039710 [Homalodisca vitripennis]